MTTKKINVYTLILGTIFVKSKHIKRFCEGIHTFCPNFHRFCPDFKSSCSDFHQIKSFEDGLAPLPPALVACTKVNRNGPERRCGKRIIAGTAFRLEFLVGWYYDADATTAVPELY